MTILHYVSARTALCNTVERPPHAPRHNYAATIKLHGTMKTSGGLWNFALSLISGFFFLMVSPSQAATYYVAPTGSDSNPGTINQPLKTIIKSLSLMHAGDTLYIRGGTYAERLNTRFMTFPNGTSWTNPITVAAYPGEVPTIRPGPGPGVIIFHRVPNQYIIIDGLVIDAIDTNSDDAVGINQGSNHIRFINCEIKNSWRNGVGIWWGNNNGLPSDHNEFVNCKIHHSGRDGRTQINGVNKPGPDTAPGLGRGHGMYISTSHNVIKNCLIYSNGEYGLKFYNETAPTTGKWASQNTIRDSILHDNGRNTTRYGHPCCGGILLASGTNNSAINNVIYNNNDIHQHGIDTGYSSTKSLVYNNTIYNVGVGIQVTSNSRNAIIKNNIVYQTTHRVIQDGGSETAWSNNLLGVDPKFIDVTAANFRLSPTSPAIDEGATLLEVESDIIGTSRPQGHSHDIGAYEAHNGSDSAPTRPIGLKVN